MAYTAVNDGIILILIIIFNILPSFSERLLKQWIKIKSIILS